MNLSGIVSPGIAGLTELTHLDLYFNEFSGSVPAGIGNCSKLVLLILNNNRFEGTIPPELGKLSVLTMCNLCNNKLHGLIPDEIGNMGSPRDSLVPYHILFASSRTWRLYGWDRILYLATSLSR
jgi:Leucine-rich repeat (LRR) protein